VTIIRSRFATFLKHKRYYDLKKEGNSPRRITCLGKIAASVLLKLFINDNNKPYPHMASHFGTHF